MSDATGNQTTVEGPIAGIDHALIGVVDLEQARESFERLGFTPSPRGRHIGWGTGNYTIMFEHDYVELLGVIDPTQYIHGLDKFLETGEGLLNVALATKDASASHQWLLQQGIDAALPEHLQRLLEGEEGDETLQFNNIHLPSDLTPGLKTFACEHLTPEKLRQPSWLSHPNGANGITEVTIGYGEP
jgi:hypothetical protein